MAKKQKLNESVRITFLEGSNKDFNSLEEAAKYVGLSPAAIKIRCNKQDTDQFGFNCNWIDEKTKLYYRAKKNRNKGRGLEYEIVSALKEIGYDGVCRSAGESKRLDNDKVDIADLNHELEVAIQAKSTTSTPNYFKIRSETKDKRPFVVIWKKTPKAGEASDGTVAMVDVKFFYELLDAYHKKNENE